MRDSLRAVPQEYLNLHLRAHVYLTDVPLHDVWRIPLGETGYPCSIERIRSVIRRAAASSPPGMGVRALFAIRNFLGRLFGWDKTPEVTAAWSLRGRLTEEDRRRSVVEPGTADGPFTTVYVHEREALNEIRNATVLAYIVWALVDDNPGCTLYVAVHVVPVSRWSGLYMNLIDPFRRLLVYPSLISYLQNAWLRYGGLSSVELSSGHSRTGRDQERREM